MHLLDIETLDKQEIERYLEGAAVMKRGLANKDWPRDRLAGRVIITLFFENSTRTRTSFEMAAYRLGASVIAWDETTSSTAKGESFSDTLRCLGAYQPDAVVVRHSEFKAPYTVKNLVSCPVINAGDSYRAHPSQALLDAFTLIEAKGTLEGLTVAICGDVAHSRVASDNFHLLSKMGANIHVVAPETLMPQKLPYEGMKAFTSIEEGIKGVHAVMMLRNQKERMAAGAVPDDAAYFHAFGLTQERLKLADKDVVVLHPAPMNRGVEIADDVADDPHRSLIFKQMENGLPVRMGIFDKLVN
ncbi:MAG: aspartate carbamoyltransferase catalytic subunit [Pseudobdellovibrionaceae bacterium]